MNIFHKLAIESLRKNRSSTFVTILGVILSAALITGVTMFGYSLLRTLADDAAIRYGDWHLAVENVDAAFLAEQKQNADVANIIVFDELGNITPSESGIACRLIGFTDESFASLPLTLISGRLPRNARELLVQEGSIIGVVGDVVSFPSEDGMQASYTIVGICSRPHFEHKGSNAQIMVIRIESLRASLPKTAFIKLHDPYSIRSYQQEIAKRSYYNNKLLRFMGIWENSSDSLIVTLMISVSVVVIGIVMLGSVFLIYNAFHISLNERTHQIGILSSVGATPKQIRHSVLYEGLCIGLIGIPSGVLLGLGAIYLVIAATANRFADVFPMAVKLQLHISLPIILGAVFISLVTILISAYIPAKKAANVSVIDCIRQTGEIKLSGKDVKTSKLSEKLFGFEGMLALKNFKRNKRQYRSVILSLVFSIVLFITTGTFTDCLSSIADHSQLLTDYEVGFGTTELDDSVLLSLFERCADLDSARKCSLRAEYIVPIVVGGSSYTASIQFTDEQSYRDYMAQCGLDASTDALPTLAKRNDNTADSISELPNLFQGTELSMKLGDQTLALICVERPMPDVPPTDQMPDELPYTLQILAPWSMKQALGQDAALWVKGITICADEPAQLKAELQSIVEADGIMGKYLLIDCTELLNANNSMAFLARLFSYTFIIMITLIAVANVFNTISTNIKLRRRELAMLRSVGMSERSFRKMMRFECVFYGLRSMFFGIPISLFLSYQVQKTMRDGMVDAGTSRFQIPWFSLSIGISAILLIIFVTMMYSVNKLKRENIIDALRDEMA